nr:MAG TPA: hypothetical protein [Caudoviricetes sp.]
MDNRRPERDGSECFNKWLYGITRWDHYAMGEITG